MELFFRIAAVAVLSFLAGSIPFGWIIVKIANGKDVRRIASGRIGGTNAMRAAGWLAGALTAFFDVLKGVATAWIVNFIFPNTELSWLRVVAALLAVWGHNNSVFLLERGEDGKLRAGGGAGGATVLGGAIALFPSIWMIILPVVVVAFGLVGFASVTTISIALSALVIFTIRFFQLKSPFEYIGYGIFALIMVIWALRPNLVRLMNGTERPVGLRAYLIKRRQKQNASPKTGEASKDKPSR